MYKSLLLCDFQTWIQRPPGSGCARPVEDMQVSESTGTTQFSRVAEECLDTLPKETDTGVFLWRRPRCQVYSCALMYMDPF